MLSRLHVYCLVFLATCFVCESKPPHIVFILVDDLGWFDVGYHGAHIDTPNIDQLARDGIVLENYYVQPICTPTRSALMTGRYPIHTGLQHGVILPPQAIGLSLDFKTLPEKMKELGYATHMVGKWHLGFYKWDFTPNKRGFDSFFGYYNGAEDHLSHKVYGFLDFRDNQKIVRDLNGTYATFAYTEHVQQIIESHKPSDPLFLYLPFQNVHAPVQAPQMYIDKYSFISDKTRRVHAAMVDITDEAIGNITKTLQTSGLWENTLLIFSTDNGGIHMSGGYNWPLRGEKNTLWEGGLRGDCFVSGPLAPRRGVVCKELLHVTDWYPTLVSLAGGLVEDDPAPMDGVNIWNTIAHGTPSPRTEILHNIDLKVNHSTSVFPFQGIALRVGDMKLMLKVPNSTWFVPPELGGKTGHDSDVDAKFQFKSYRSTDTTDLRTLHFHVVSQVVIEQALYNITADPTEHIDLSAKFPDIVAKMKDRVAFYMKGVVPPIMKPIDQKAIETARKNGAWTPWE